MTLKKLLPLIITLGSTLGAAFLTPDVIAAHPQVFSSLTSIALVLHAVLPSVFGAPQTPPQQ